VLAALTADEESLAVPLLPAACLRCRPGHGRQVCVATPKREVRIEIDCAAPGTARAFVSRWWCRVHGAGDLDRARLLVSELVANVLRHAGPPLEIVLDCDGERLQVWVRDGTPAQEADLGAPGRGIGLLDMVCDQCGLTPLPGGKAVRFELHTRP